MIDAKELEYWINNPEHLMHVYKRRMLAQELLMAHKCKGEIQRKNIEMFEINKKLLKENRRLQKQVVNKTGRRVIN